MPVAKQASDSSIIVAAAAAHAAGVSASLLCDRVELLGATEPARLTTDHLGTDIADIATAARQLTSAVTRVLATLEPETQPRVAAITEAAFQTRLLLLTPADAAPAPIARALREGSRATLHAGGSAPPPSAVSSSADVQPPHGRRGGHVGRCPDPDSVPHPPGPAASDSPRPAAWARVG